LIEDCLKGLELAIFYKWYEAPSFDVVAYQHYERVENGDLNWIVPGRFLAFSGPLP
jgi:cell division cycle 14